MNKDQYLQQQDITNFSQWLASKLCGGPVNFNVVGHTNYTTLRNALDDYQWPNKRVDGLRSKETGFQYPVVASLAAKSNLADNTQVLNVIQNALQTAYHMGNPSCNVLSGATAAVLHWGGVYTTIKKNGKRHGNKAWLEDNHDQLHAILEAVITDHAHGDDRSTINGLRFNSGMTKVYSLLIDNFIIYDSRVAATLAWLALQWWTAQGHPPDRFPALLRFGCMDGRAKLKGCRNPDTNLFPLISSRAEDHYMWNVRANWLLLDARQRAGRDSEFGSLREIEAALFQIGYKIK